MKDFDWVSALMAGAVLYGVARWRGWLSADAPFAAIGTDGSKA